MDQIAIQTGFAATSIAAIISNDLPSPGQNEEGVVLTRQGDDYYVSTWVQAYVVSADGEIIKLEED